MVSSERTRLSQSLSPLTTYWQIGLQETSLQFSICGAVTWLAHATREVDTSNFPARYSQYFNCKNVLVVSKDAQYKSDHIQGSVEEH